MFSAFNTFGKLGAPAGSRSLLAQIQAMGASFIGIPSLANYQDSEGTLLVTQPGGGSADPPVGLVLDKSGNANNASQATSTARPKLSARINQFAKSQQFDDTSADGWARQNAGVTTDGTLTPDGRLAFKFSASTSADAYLQKIITTVAGVPVVTYFDVKAGSSDIFTILYLNQGVALNNVRFDLTNQTATAIDGTAVGSIALVSAGFYRCTLTKTPPVGNNNDLIWAYPGAVGAITSGQSVYLSLSQLAELSARYQRVTDANTYDYSGFPFVHVFDGVDDAHVITFPSSLGSACTVVTANRGAAPTIQTGQTIGTSHTISATHAGKLIFPRALTAAETATVTAWATRQGAL